MTPDLITYAIAGLAFVAIAGLGMAFAGADRGKQSKRLKAISDGTRRSGNATEAAGLARRKQMDATTKALRDREEANRKKKVGKSLEDKIKQSGMNITIPVFYMASVAAGIATFIALFLGPQLNSDMMLLANVGISFAAAFGAPRWFLGMKIAGRQKKFISQFADAIDVIVRGVKSGLPLHECLKMIAKESPQPLGGEFQIVCDAIAMGVDVPQALDKMYQRTPIQEVNFFNIVLNIQQKAGGNLSEALGNLSNVLRSRKLLREKIKALSSEAKASAMIIGSLPIIVMLLVYFTTPSYIMSLFVTDLGHLILLIAAALMGIGIYIMRSMINFAI
ncbi:MAG TPA: type II secretion system F family protein [Hyphomonadaceae bacterium]|nr:type II secretion system F family protein [Hyphomonadaceae bacterium]HPN07156.1 type II secretion system F family protein [Hyphomonadaceae bacterium]